MNYTTSPWAIAIFVAFVSFVLWIAYYYAKRTKTAKGYYAAGGNIHWAVNGIAFAGDYLSAASFLGICGMIAAYGYDGFLYSIGYLAGWIVALFVVAEPMKRLGKYTFTDALDSRFNSKGIQLTAAISTLVVSIFYLIPQMVGAGVLVTPLFGMPHYLGVIIVGAIVTVIVATAGMASTTYVQFLKGGLLIIFSMTVVIAVLSRGLSTAPDHGGEKPYHQFVTVPYTVQANGALALDDPALTAPADWKTSPYYHADGKAHFVQLAKEGQTSVWRINEEKGVLEETLTIAHLASGEKLYNGAPRGENKFFPVGHMDEIILKGEKVDKTGNLDPTEYLSVILNGNVVIWPSEKLKIGSDVMTVYYQKVVAGKDLLRPGMKFKIGGSIWQNMDFISLMLALFCGTAALPHILIRYYTVPSPACARKSTIVAIAAIGFFYVLTLFMGLGAMTSGVIDLSDTNMAAPLLAKSFGIFLFAIISAIAFATVLGTVSGLIVAASGAVAHDLVDRFMGVKMSDTGKVNAGKISAIVIGIIAMILGIKYEGMNVSYLVGWAFAVAASANLPAIIMLLFWKRTTSAGIAASVVVGIVSSVGMILLSPEMYVQLYNLPAEQAPIPISSPALFTVPLSFLTLVVVSLFTKRKTVLSPEELAEVEERLALPAIDPAEAAYLATLEQRSPEELVEIIKDLRAEIATLKDDAPTR